MKRTSRRTRGTGSLEVHGRTYRAHYYRLDPDSPSGFVRVSEGTGILVDGSGDVDARTGKPDPKTALHRAELWLEERSYAYRQFVRHGKLEDDAERLAKVARVAQARADGLLCASAQSLDEAEANLPAYTFAEAWNAFDSDITSRRRDPSTHANYRQWFSLFTDWVTKTHHGVTELRHVTPRIAREYAGVLLDRVRGTTYNRHLNALTLIWATLSSRDADGKPNHPQARLCGNPFSWDKATRSGIPRIKLERDERPHRRRDLTIEEVANLIHTAKGEMRGLIALGFYTGLRLGDCVTLKEVNVDRVLGTINVRSRKTGIDTQTAIHPALCEILKGCTQSHGGYVLPDLAALYNHGPSGRIELTKRILALFTACGIETSYREDGKRARPEAGFHSLRHSYATQLARAQVTIADRRQAMGHASEAMTRHYTHGYTGAALSLPFIDASKPPQDQFLVSNGNPSTRTASTLPTGGFGGVCAIVDTLDGEELKKLAAYISRRIRTPQ